MHQHLESYGLKILRPLTCVPNRPSINCKIECLDGAQKKNTGIQWEWHKGTVPISMRFNLLVEFIQNSYETNYSTGIFVGFIETQSYVLKVFIGNLPLGFRSFIIPPFFCLFQRGFKLNFSSSKDKARQLMGSRICLLFHGK